MKNLNIQLFAANPNAVIPSAEGRGGRSIDKGWKQAELLARAMQGALGLEFGNVLTIQEAGVKEENKLYLDSLDGKLYRCKKRTESLANTTELFELFSVKTNSDRLDNLIKVEIVGRSAFEGLSYEEIYCKKIKFSNLLMIYTFYFSQKTNHITTFRFPEAFEDTPVVSLQGGHVSYDQSLIYTGHVDKWHLPFKATGSGEDTFVYGYLIGIPSKS